MTVGWLAELAQLAGERQVALDDKIANWRSSADKVHLWCSSGCGNCCTLAVNATFPEALAIAALLDDVQRTQLSATATRVIAHARQCSDGRSFLNHYRHAVGPCPFLNVEADCTIYEQRPLACRALLDTRPADWCGVNLAELSELEQTLFLDSLDRAVVAWPTHYAATPQNLAADFERGLIFAMIRITGFGLTGNLPLLVWLAGQSGLAEAVADGPPAFLTFLASHRIEQSFLAQIQVP